MTRIEEIEARKAEIRELMNAEGADLNLDELTEEVRALNAEIETIKENAAKADELRTLVAKGEGEVVETAPITTEERKEKPNMEVRNTPEYINAYAEYIKTGRDEELRALLMSDNTVGGTVPVPTIVDDIIHTAWEREGITSLVRKSYVKGNLKVGYEISADAAEVHSEGAEAIDSEDLVLGKAELIPYSIKKFVLVSDEAMDLTGEAFLRYLYDEIAHQIALKAAEEIVVKILAATSPMAYTLTENPALSTVADAIAHLGDSAVNPVVLMSRGTWATFKAIQYGANFPVDPFEGLNVVFTSALDDYTANSGDEYMIVGDLGAGYLCNFPRGEEITIKYDDLTYAESDLVKIVGRMFIGHGIVTPKCFTVVKATS